MAGLVDLVGCLLIQVKTFFGEFNIDGMKATTPNPSRGRELDAAIL